MSTTEIIKAFVSPAEKLIDVIQSAIGTAFEPRKIKRNADAEAYRINKIADAVRNN